MQNGFYTFECKEQNLSSTVKIIVSRRVLTIKNGYFKGHMSHYQLANKTKAFSLEFHCSVTFHFFLINFFTAMKIHPRFRVMY